MSLDFFLILILFVLYFKKKLLFLQRSREKEKPEEAFWKLDYSEDKSECL